jgi:aminopeptidase 2
MSCVENNERQILPKTVKPTHYELTLQPDLTIFTFHGQVKVK